MLITREENAASDSELLSRRSDGDLRDLGRLTGSVLRQNQPEILHRLRPGRDFHPATTCVRFGARGTAASRATQIDAFCTSLL